MGAGESGARDRRLRFGGGHEELPDVAVAEVFQHEERDALRDADAVATVPGG